MALKKIGGLWKPDGSRQSKAVLTGKMDDGRKVFIFPNEKGDNPKRPDYNITVQVEDGADAAPQETQRGEIWGGQAPARDVTDDDVPF